MTRFFRLAFWMMLGLFSAQSWSAAVHDRYFMSRDGLRLHYLEAGSGSRTIVFIPGWLMPAEVFRYQLEGLGQDFHVLAFDPRSQGKSQVSDGSHAPEVRMDDMEDFLHAADLHDFVLAGWSLGVLEVLDFIAHKPQMGLKGLILIDNSIGEASPPRPSSGASARNSRNPAVRERYLKEFSRSIFARQPNPHLLDAVFASALQVPARAARQLLAQPYPRTYWKQTVLAQHVPVLYVIRPNFRAQGAALLEDKKDARVEVFENAGHALFVDAAARFNDLVASFAGPLWDAGVPSPHAAQSATSATRLP